MKNTGKVGILIGIGALIIAIAIMMVPNEKSGSMEVEDVLNRELSPSEDVTPEVQEKLDDIEKIKLENEYSPSPREWITSGPFQIDRSKYVVGEKIFLVIGGLESQEKGQVAFLRPLNDTHKKVYQTVPFDGTKKNAFNYYIQPQLSKVAGICTIDDIAGDWTVVFRGTDYANLEFEITDKILPGDEDNYQSVC